MFRKISTTLLIIFFIATTIHAQKACWVFFTDKNGTTFNPYTYFAPEAIQRRQKLNISLYDSTDFPVNQNYVQAVSEKVISVGYQTRWFNGVGVVATEEQIIEVKKLPFVREVVYQAVYEANLASKKSTPLNSIRDTLVTAVDGTERKLSQQIDPLQGNLFAEHNYKGKGIVIAILDAGFKGANTHEAFRNIRLNNQIRASFDFVKNDADVYSTNTDHGTKVLSCIAGMMGEVQMGLAPDATFLLARIGHEYGNQYKGEENFVAAVEWSDKQGAMIINCSGGPGERAYFPEDMDGKKPLISRASNMAASKGILVIAAAGNEGQTNEPNLLPPSDADSVLSVTATNDDGYAADYSSRGPLPDFRRKPDVCAPGTAVVANGKGDYEIGEGTSFSAPLLVGFAACLLQMYPDLSPMTLADTMRISGSLYPYYDYSHGYGVPQADWFFGKKVKTQPTFTINHVGDSAQIIIRENFKPDCTTGKKYLLYYSLEDSKGRIYKYKVMDIEKMNPVTIYEYQWKAGVTLHVFYQGFYAKELF